MAEPTQINWDPPTLQRRAAAHATDWGLSLLFTMIIAAPAILEWGMPRHVIAAAILPIHALWQSAWIIATGRSFGQRAVGIWVLDNTPEPLQTTTRQRAVLTTLKVAATLLPLTPVTYPLMVFQAMTRDDQRHFIDRLSSTKSCHPRVQHLQHPEQSYEEQPTHTGN